MGRDTLEYFKRFRSRIEDALLGFVLDPADSDYQKGYEDALREVKKELDSFMKT